MKSVYLYIYIYICICIRIHTPILKCHQPPTKKCDIKILWKTKRDGLSQTLKMWPWLQSDVACRRPTAPRWGPLRRSAQSAWSVPHTDCGWLWLCRKEGWFERKILWCDAPKKTIHWVHCILESLHLVHIWIKFNQIMEKTWKNSPFFQIVPSPASIYSLGLLPPKGGTYFASFF